NYSNNFENDIALLHTTKDIPLYPAVNNINSICLPAQDVLFNERVTVTGWGHVDDEGNTSEHLMTVDLNILNDKLCKDQFKSKDSCRGDSGGPLIKVRFGKAYLIGIVSYVVTECALEKIPAQFTQ
ncbi:venom protease-like protein, partial [Dinothrombium tinctorium]